MPLLALQSGPSLDGGTQEGENVVLESKGAAKRSRAALRAQSNNVGTRAKCSCLGAGKVSRRVRICAALRKAGHGRRWSEDPLPKLVIIEHLPCPSIAHASHRSSLTLPIYHAHRPPCPNTLHRVVPPLVPRALPAGIPPLPFATAR